jgi:hypothetical protein
MNRHERRRTRKTKAYSFADFYEDAGWTMHCSIARLEEFFGLTAAVPPFPATWSSSARP